MDHKPLIYHFARCGYSRMLVALCEDALKRRGNEPAVVFWRAFGAAREGNFAQAIRDCESLKSRRDSEYAALVALSVYHSASKLVDRGALMLVEEALPGANDRAVPASLVLAGTFLWIIGRADDAQACADRVLRDNPAHDGALALSGWLGATSGMAVGLGALSISTDTALLMSGGVPPLGPSRSDADSAANSVKAFQTIIGSAPPGKRDIDACMGLAAAYERVGEYERALDVLTDVTAGAAWFWPAITAKARVLIRLGDWQQCDEILHSSLESDASNIEALRLYTLVSFVQVGNGGASVERLAALVAAATDAEPRNHKLLIDMARCFARLSGGSRYVLAQTLTLVEAACRADPESSGYCCELGYQRLLAADVGGAATAYRDAAKLDESNAEAVRGMIAVQAAQGAYDDAEDQLEMFRMIAESLGKSAEVALLEAVVAGRKHHDRTQQLAALQEAVELHLQAIKDAVGFVPESDAAPASSKVSRSVTAAGLPAGVAPAPLPPATVDVFHYYSLVNCELMMDIAREFLVIPTVKASTGSALSAAAPSAGGSGRAGGTSAANTAAGASFGALLTVVPAADANDVAAPPVRKGLGVLDCVCGVVPAYLPAWLLIAVTRASCGDGAGAIRAVSKCLDLDPSYIDAYLLLAHVALAQSDSKMAAGALEEALSHNFSIQESAVYQRMRAKVLQSTGRIEDAITTLETALKLPGVRIATAGVVSTSAAAAVAPSASGAGGTGRTGRAATLNNMQRGGTSTGASDSKANGGSSGAAVSVPLADRAAIFLQAVECYIAANRLADAGRTVNDAMAEFTGTPEETAVVIASAQYALARGDVDGALSQLKAVPSTAPAYQAALAVKAEIYLKHRRDRAKYIRCFADIAGRAKTERSFVALGDAYLRMGQPEEATEAYQQAVALSPANTDLHCKIARAFITQHDYRRAVQYYNTLLQQEPGSGSNSGPALDRAMLRADLTELLVKLQRFSDAEKLIKEAMAEGGDSDDAVGLRFTRRNLLLLAKVQRSAKDMAAAIASLENALSVQTKLLALARRGDAGSAAVVDSERQEAAKLCLELGSACEAATPARDDAAREYYTTGLRHADDYSPLYLALARLHLRRGEIEECRAMGTAVTTRDPNNQDAITMLADLLFRENDVPAATFHFQQLLEAQPCNWAIQYKLCLLLKRAGKVAEVPRFLRLASRKRPSAENEPGYKLVMGVYHRFNNQPHDAIKMLNAARIGGGNLSSGSTAGVGTAASGGVASASSGMSNNITTLATEHMVRIYLSPDGDPLWLDRDAAGAAAASGGAGSAPQADTSSAATVARIAESIRVAAHLLTELPPASRTAYHDVLGTYPVMLSKSKGSGSGSSSGCDEAIGRLATILEADPDNVPALLALSTAFALSKQQPKARNQLKRLLKLPFDSNYTDEFVQAWLCLADLQAESGKFDLAQEALQRALQLDASCSRALEALGGIAEREMRYAEAAELYEKAWRFDNNSSAPVGYKLAFNYLKAGRYVPAIDVCRKVLTLFPDYPRIKAEVMDRARALLRT